MDFQYYLYAQCNILLGNEDFNRMKLIPELTEMLIYSISTIYNIIPFFYNYFIGEVMRILSQQRQPQTCLANRRGRNEYIFIPT